jgi:hypothetical protein
MESTICNSYDDDYKQPIYNGVIKGYKGSTAEEYAKKYDITFIALDDEKEPVYGDANCDGKVSVADAVAILQFIGNRDKYALTEQGAKNADVDGIAGITGKDALVIQQVDAGLYKAEDLPLKAE